MNRPVIALLTDYGGNGPYVGAIKAVILATNPDAALIDLAHDVPAQAVEEGAFVLAEVAPLLPDGAICVAVVDPGVGTTRRAIAIRTPRCTFVGPDNGLLSVAVGDEQRGKADPVRARAVDLPAGSRAVELLNTEYQRRPVSATFHGRDIFAPAAAHLSLGVPFDVLGPDLLSVQAFPAWRATADQDGSLQGRVLHADSFGNLVTDVRAEDAPGRFCLYVEGRIFSGPQRTFHDGPEFVVYAGSSGFLEIGQRDGNAARALGIGPGAAVRVVKRG